MPDRIISRILTKLDSPGLLDTLAEKASGPDLASILLETYRRRAERLSARAVLNQYRTDRFSAPARFAQKDAIDLDSLAFRLLPPGFETVELSPVCPLGTSSVLAPVNQNNVVTTARNSEVCSDVTNVLALEAAVRRGELTDPFNEQTRLCTSHRHLRAQVFAGPASFAHFRILALCTAGRTTGNFTRESEAVSQHVIYYLTVLRELVESGYRIGQVRVELIPFTREALRVADQNIAPRISNATAAVTVIRSLAPETRYYVDLRFKAFATDKSGNEYNIVDGGFTDWTRSLLSNNKEFFLASGLGTERLNFCFRSSA